MQEEAPADGVRRRFDHVLVDEYQDTNALQAGILVGLKPDGRGLTVVGDDAQSIYSFRAATVRNILDFPRQFDPPAHVVTLEQNYRSTQPILDAANAVIALAPEGFRKRLFSTRQSEQRPSLVTAEDEQAQVECVVQWVLEHREAGVDLNRQAVLMRAAHHSDLLEVELGRRNIPFVKYGGLKFLEAAHVKDVLCVLRWAENPRDGVAGFRVLQLLPGFGPAHARRLQERLEGVGVDFAGLGGVAVGDEAADPYLDEDYLILSTIHSAKGQEWDVVYVLNVVDGCIPSDMATGTPEQVEEERRLLYVAMTRARDHLYLLHPHRFYTRRRPNGDNHVHAPRTRFIPDALLPLFERRAHGTLHATDSLGSPVAAWIDVQTRLREM